MIFSGRRDVMLAIKGTYKDGKISLEEKVNISKTVKVIITFLDDYEAKTSKKFDFKNFSFDKSKELLKDYQGSLSDAIIEERRNAL